MTGYSRVYAGIHLDAAAENLKNMKDRLKENTKMIAVIKTDGYGHGALPIAKMTENYEYIWGYAVATVQEAVSLREAGIGKPILILGYTFAEDYDQLAKYDIRPAVFKLSMAEELSQAAVSCGKTIKLHIALDTGMTRIGFRDDPKNIAVIRQIAALQGLEIEGMFTHFARADEKDKQAALAQFQRYCEFVQALEAAGVSIPMKHCSNSAGILELPQVQLDAVRAGITIYGIYPSEEMDRDNFKLQPVMELKSHIAYIKDVEAGVPISYGGTYVTPHAMKVATIPVGYGDGYPRSLSNKGWVLIRGHKAPILGRICMDQFMVDVTDIPAQELDEVTLLGRDEEEEITIDVLGELSGRFPYEFVCDIGKRVPRLYFRNGKQIEA